MPAYKASDIAFGTPSLSKESALIKALGTMDIQGGIARLQAEEVAAQRAAERQQARTAFNANMVESGMLHPNTAYQLTHATLGAPTDMAQNPFWRLVPQQQQY